MKKVDIALRVLAIKVRKNLVNFRAERGRIGILFVGRVCVGGAWQTRDDPRNNWRVLGILPERVHKVGAQGIPLGLEQPVTVFLNR